MTVIDTTPNTVKLDDLYRDDPAAFYALLDAQSARKAEVEANQPSDVRRNRTRVFFNRFVIDK